MIDYLIIIILVLNLSLTFMMFYNFKQKSEIEKITTNQKTKMPKNFLKAFTVSDKKKPVINDDKKAWSQENNIEI